MVTLMVALTAAMAIAKTENALESFMFDKSNDVKDKGVT